MKQKFPVPPKHLINKKKMLSWYSWKEGNIEYFTEIRYFMGPMWLYYLLNKIIKFFENIKHKLVYTWEADWKQSK